MCAKERSHHHDDQITGEVAVPLLEEGQGHFLPVAVSSSPSHSTRGNDHGRSTPYVKKHKRSHSDTTNVPKNNVNSGQRRQTVETGSLDFILHNTLSAAPSVTASLRHRIKIEEVVPESSSYIETTPNEPDSYYDIGQSWKANLDAFTSKKMSDHHLKSMPRNVRQYYKMQEDLIKAYEELHKTDDTLAEHQQAEEIAKKKRAETLSKISFFCNLLLLIAKAIAAGLSGSLAVISSVVDSAVDLVSGALMWWSNRAIKRRNIYLYPQGRTKLEPVAIVILSVVMALASVQLIRESIEKVISLYHKDGSGPTFTIITIIICACTVGIKLVLYLICCGVKNPSVQALAQDHRNDVISNTAAIVFGIIGDKLWAYADPGGAILISLYIIINWLLTGKEQIKMLTGHTARPDFLKKITWIALNHHPKVLMIDTVRAFHFGNNFLVEVDIVLPEELTLRESHDIGESLQIKLERLPEIERAFVHLDYETEHNPFSEHKQV